MAIKRPYQMKTISSNLFVIDRKSYQRKKDKDKIAHIVSKWDERIANEPKISARDGKFYVFDGQHTILARESMNGEKPTEILCKVYKGMDAKEEARLFAMQTGFSSKLRSGEALRANLFGEEAEAVAFNAATEKVGIQVELKGTRFERHLACVSTALNAYRNQIPDSDYTIAGYELKNTAVRKRKDGKLISPDYYITEIRTSTDGSMIFNVYAINLIDSSVKMTSHSVSGNGKVTVVEETVKTGKGPAKMSYLRIDENCTVPVTLNDYKSSQLIESICN